MKGVSRGIVWGAGVLLCLLILGPFATTGAGAVEAVNGAGGEAACAGALDTCLEHKAGMPYLAAAYMALWLLLIGFFFRIRRSQVMLRREVEELRGLLREMERDE